MIQESQANNNPSGNEVFAPSFVAHALTSLEFWQTVLLEILTSAPSVAVQLLKVHAVFVKVASNKQNEQAISDPTDQLVKRG